MFIISKPSLFIILIVYLVLTILNLESTVAVDSFSHVAVVNLGVIGVGELDDQLEHCKLDDQCQQSASHYLHQRTKSKGSESSRIY